jgi:hypothetical protein
MQPVSRERISKQILVATNTHATMEKPISKQRISKHTTRGVVGNGVLCSVLAKWLQQKVPLRRIELSFGVGGCSRDLRESAAEGN